MVQSENNILKFEKYNKALIIGIGGGGDVLGTLPTRELLRKLGVDVYLGSLTYERSQFDPVPGPRPLDEIKHVKIINQTVGLANNGTETFDGVKFQASKMSAFLNEEIFLVDITKGVRGVIAGLNDVIDRYSFDLIVGVDVGGDVLATGDEKGLRSPLTDAIILSALKNITKASTAIGVFGVCCDGELTLEEVSSRLTEVYSKGGFIGCYPLSFETINLMKEGLKYVDTEASKLPLKIADGVSGEMRIRGGSRKVNLSFFSIFTYYLKTGVVYRVNGIADLISETKSFIEAHNIVSKKNIITEYKIQLEKAKQRLG